MAINPDVDIWLAVEKLGKSDNFYQCSNGVPPHTITYWEEGNKDTQPTDDEINAAWEAYKAEDQYKAKRMDSYPEIQDQLDMQYWDSVNGTTTWKDAIAKVKSDYPKPS